MLIAVNAVGRMKAGPEQELAQRYFDRLARSGPGIGLEFAGVCEVAEGRSQSADRTGSIPASAPTPSSSCRSASSPGRISSPASCSPNSSIAP